MKHIEWLFFGWIGGKHQLRKEIIARFPADGVSRLRQAE